MLTSEGRRVFIKGTIDRLVKDFGLVLREVVEYRVPGASGTVCSRGLQDSGIVDGGEKGSYRVVGVILAQIAGMPAVACGL
ncbi:MAG: hypothetical protein CME15_01940 [Gemmatimonadetes bacterium]|jgi:hypothetical protein|nr:hypothetical protein [Gemmatimonadota bacterium]|tara:strand:+ start:88 stop:330 length:243 start_codon:yes stop_codon:yes gene_type:complete